MTLRENKAFLARAVTWVAEQGIGQFIDAGAGMPTSPATHETARAAVPGARVAYIDNDPVVLAHLAALAAHGNTGVTAIDGDVREPDTVMRAVAEGIDLAVPSCLPDHGVAAALLRAPGRASCGQVRGGAGTGQLRFAHTG